MKTEEFLQELTELTRKHGIEIGGCGCCGSPWLNELKHPEGKYIMMDNSDPDYPEELSWDSGER